MENSSKPNDNVNKRSLDFEKYYKKMDCGFTFYSLISRSKAFVIGKIELQEGLPKPESKNEDDSNINIYSFDFSRERDRVKYSPFHVSCSKNSIAVIVKEQQEIKRNDEDIKEYSDFLAEIRSSLKEKRKSFQNFFLKELTTEKMFSNQSDPNEGKYTINDTEFKEKISELINITEKVQIILLRFTDKLKGKSNMNGKIDLLLFYNLLFSTDFQQTKISLFGSIVDVLEEKMTKDTVDFCRRNYESHYIYDIPLITLPVRQLELGEEHVLLLTCDGVVYGWGDSKYGACGIGTNEFTSKPKKIKFPIENTEIISIACGSRHSLAIDVNNCLYSWGQGKNGCLGHGNEHDLTSPKLVESMSNNKVEYISAGDNYSACVTSQMQLFTWGSGEFGRLGHPEFKNELTPKKVEEMKEPVILVRCSYYCLLAFTTTRQVHAFGSKALFIKKQSDKIDTKIPYLKNIKEQRKIEIPTIPEKEVDVVDCVCGYQFLCLITEERLIRTRDKEKKWENDRKTTLTKTSLASVGEKYEKIERFNYIWGYLNLSSSKFNQNFKERKNFIDTKTEDIINLESQFINYLSGGKSISQSEENGVKKIICSDNNTAILTLEGELYVFGSYLFGVASKKLDQMYYPVPFRNKKVRKIALGGNHIMVLTSSLEVYGWGRNDCGQLGLGNAYKFHDTPILLEKLKNRGIRTIKCSENYSACLSFNFELIIFGDISFLENSQYINHQLNPKTMEWGEVYKICCAPTHLILFIRDKDSKNIEIKSVGNGSYGKLGTNSENDDNFYTPVPIDIQLNYTEKTLSKQIKISCSRYMSAVLEITSSSGTHLSNLWVFGLCFKSLFSSRDLENLKNAKRKYQSIDPNMCVQPKPIKIVNWENVKKISLSETAIYVINNKDEIKYNGMFFSQKKDVISEKKINIRGQFKDVSVGIDHAAGITMKNYLFTWGYNFMNKLGVVESNENLDKLNLDSDFESNIAAFFHKEPENIVEINKFFDRPDNKGTTPTKEEIITKNVETEDKIEEDEDEEKEEKKEQDQNDVDNIYTECQRIVRNKFEDIENQILRTEQNFKDLIVKIMSSYGFLLNYEAETQNLKRVLYNQVNFRMIEPPLRINLKKDRKRKYPLQFYQYRKNYKSLLTTLRVHPCYLIKIYENKLMSDKDLYTVIKQLFSNIYNDKYSKLLLITIAKMVLEKDLRTEKERIDMDNLKNKDKQKKLNILDEYKIIKVDKDPIEINLFGKLFKLIFKSEIEENIHKSDAVAAIIVNHIYKLVGSKIGQGEMEKAMAIFNHPEDRNVEQQTFSASALTVKIEYVFNIINMIFELMILPSNDETIIAKEYVFNLQKEIYNAKSKDQENADKIHFISYGKITRTMIKEMYSSFKKITEIKDLEKIDDWMGKNLGLLLFRRVIKIIGNPNSLLTINSSIAIDKVSFKSFMERCKNNFYTVSFIFEHILKCLLANEDTQIGGEEESFKKINKKVADSRSSFINNLKNVVSRAEQEEKGQRTDIFNLEQFFIHSLNEKIYPINFSLFLLKKLHVLLVANIDKIRVLNKGFDLLDVIFFNSNPEYYLGLENGLATFNISEDDTTKVQQRLKTRALAYENPKNLNRCMMCRVVILKEFNYSNEETFFDECFMYMKNSKQGYVIQIFKEMKNITSDNITEIFKQELKNPSNKIRENLFLLFAMFAYEKKSDLMLEEDDLKQEEKLFDIMLNDKTMKVKISDISKEIIEKYKDMEDHRIYQKKLENSLNNIAQFIIVKEDETYIKNLAMIKESLCLSENTKKSKSEMYFNLELFKRIQKNFEKGYGNPDLEKHADSLDNNAMLVNLIKSIAEMPKSKNLFEKLSVNKKSKLLPFREYSLKKLIDERIILKVLIKTGDINLYSVAQNYKILIQKTPNSEFNISLVKINQAKSGFLAVCSSTKKEESSVLIHNELLTNQTLNRVMNCSYKNNTHTRIGDFLEIEAKAFIGMLKSLTVLGLDQ